MVDGDSLRFPGVEVRLEGLDAPEMSQHCWRGDPPRSWPCGRVAAAELRKLVADRPVTCHGVPQADGSVRDRYNRLLGDCHVDGSVFQNGTYSINAYMVEQGMAVAFTRYSLAYVEHEARAIAGRRGLHGGTFVRPEQWRAWRRATEIGGDDGDRSKWRLRFRENLPHRGVHGARRLQILHPDIGRRAPPPHPADRRP